MGSRLAGRLLTSPLAFIVAGLLDLGLFVVRVLAGRISRALPRTARPRRPGSGISPP